jgi:hypothetical protein
MHRILAQNGELKERHNQLRHPRYEKPELLATGPNLVWRGDHHSGIARQTPEMQHYDWAEQIL